MLGRRKRENFSMAFLVCKVLYKWQSLMQFDLVSTNILRSVDIISIFFRSTNRLQADGMRFKEKSFGQKGILECGYGGNCPAVESPGVPPLICSLLTSVTALSLPVP